MTVIPASAPGFPRGHWSERVSEGRVWGDARKKDIGDGRKKMLCHHWKHAEEPTLDTVESYGSVTGGQAQPGESTQSASVDLNTHVKLPIQQVLWHSAFWDS